MVNFWNNGKYSFGVFGGVEGEYHYFLEGAYDNYHQKVYENFKKIHSYGINGRVGLSALFAEHHRVKLPILIAGNNWIYSNASYLVKTSFDIGYKYVFYKNILRINTNLSERVKNSLLFSLNFNQTIWLVKSCVKILRVWLQNLLNILI